ncbi:MAG: thioredoxin family protein [Alphaproteobacteria bacterium HGW-Alphaproteobacteria-18]|nr:MAG: thioredoxin family protein [Alphaproteobacteria bacterium HGW-Alphaproteobacteria-18]
MKLVKILGPGCKRCDALVTMVKDAADKAGIDIEVEKVTDYAEIARAGAVSTPGLVIDGKLVHAGGLPRPESVRDWLNA